MSADNYILVDVKDGVFRVWNGSASMEEAPETYTTPIFSTTDLSKAIGIASSEYSEYGISFSEEVRKELRVTNMKKDSMHLTGVAWKKSDASDNSKDRDGWSFVASHAEEIVRFLWTEGK